MDRLNKFTRFVYRIFKSKKFFYIVVGLLVLQAAWFALSAQYPMAFDENYHFGIIQIYSHQWLPFITSAPAGSGALGDITRFDSYLYHYLMSFPYRLIAIFINDQVTQIIILRLINIGLFVGGLFLFRRLFRRFNISERLINFSLLMLVLIPVVPFLAATINYDNLVFLLVPLTAIFTLNCTDEIIKNKKIPAKSLLLLITISLLSCLVKYAFLPIFTAEILYLLFVFVRSKSRQKLLPTFTSSFKSLRLGVKAILVISLIVSAGLFIERYGVNLIQYHSVEPDCAKVQSVATCMQYGPWARDYQIAQDITAHNTATVPPIGYYVPVWIAGMIYRLYFAINYNYTNYPPLLIPFTIAAIIGILGLILAVVYRRQIIRVNRRLLMLVLVIILYVGGIVYSNFSEYLSYRQPLAINGRYLIIVLPFIFIIFGLAFKTWFIKLSKTKSSIIIAITSVAVILLTLQGGGALTYLVRSQPNWYWQNKSLVDFNMNLKNAVSPFIIGNNTDWFYGYRQD